MPSPVKRQPNIDVVDPDTNEHRLLDLLSGYRALEPRSKRLTNTTTQASKPRDVTENSRTNDTEPANAEDWADFEL